MFDSPKLLPENRMAIRLGNVDKAWLRAEADAGRLPHIRAGERYLFDPDTVERLLLERARQPFADNSLIEAVAPLALEVQVARAILDERTKHHASMVARFRELGAERDRLRQELKAANTARRRAVVADATGQSGPSDPASATRAVKELETRLGELEERRGVLVEEVQEAERDVAHAKGALNAACRRAGHAAREQLERRLDVFVERMRSELIEPAERLAAALIACGELPSAVSPPALLGVREGRELNRRDLGSYRIDTGRLKLPADFSDRRASLAWLELLLERALTTGGNEAAGQAAEAVQGQDPTQVEELPK